jgi:NTP pyrophosphatase (non-canonical NTP hydrolase)
MMDFQDIIQRALVIRQKYVTLEQTRYGASWNNEELALGFVGDLAKLIIAKNGRRTIPDTDEKLAHELADCLWSIIVIANAHTVDLESAFVQTMNGLEIHINDLLAEK